jgi:septum formation protein
MNFNSIKIILASQSPRRQQLLRESGIYNFTVRPTDTDETLPETYNAVEVAAGLAQKKATAARIWIESNHDVVIAADTTVVLDDVIYNKPESFADAQRILRCLSGKMHQVITGVCLLSKEKEIVFSDVSNVYFDVLSEADITYYLETCKPFDKAGAYGIQEWIGHCKIQKIEGSYSNIMGLPTHKLFKELAHFCTAI